MSYTDPYPGRRGNERIVQDCGACSGTGLYDGPTHATFYTQAVGLVAPGCFACGGSGKRSFLVSSARAKARRHAKKAEEAAQRVKLIDERVDAFRLKHGELADRVVLVRDSLRPGDPVSRKLSAAIDSLYGTALVEDFDDDAWAESARDTLAEYDSREAAKRDVPTGRLELTGMIRSAKYVENGYGSTLKMLVEGDGWKVWGSVPKSVADEEYDRYYEGLNPDLDGAGVWTEAIIGREITFTATVSPSDDDRSFGFFTRPTKARIEQAG